jgi:hypothetical protein
MTTDLRQPGTLAANALARVWESVSIYHGPDVFLKQFSALSEPQQHLFSTWWCDHEICNGGFLQLFGNSTGVLVPEAAVGYRALSLLDVAAAIDEAMGYFKPTYPRDHASRLAKVKELCAIAKSPFDALDERYYSLLPWRDGRFQRAADIYAAQKVI